MRRVFLAAASTAVTALLLAAGPAAAAVTIAPTNGTPLDYKVTNEGAPNGTSVQEKTNPSGFHVTYSTDSGNPATIDLTEAGNDGNGFAQVKGVSASDQSTDTGFPNLTITPDSPLVGFSELKFKLDLPKTDLNGNLSWTFDATVIAGGTTYVFDDVSTSGDNRFLVDGDGSTITSITLSDLVATQPAHGKDSAQSEDVNFEALKQVSFDAVVSGVPEPASWALMLLGFAGLGSALRSRRRAAPVAA